MSHFFFLCVVESLASLMREGVSKKLFSGVSIGKNQVEVDLLQFVDDTLFFAKSSMDNVMTLKSILRCFELALSLL